MVLYEKLPSDILISFYDEILKNINEGILTKNMYYELGIIISVANRRSIILEEPCDFEQMVDQETLNDFIQCAHVS
ncbi:hypothetical protein R4Z10_21210 (plasmid) [Niallia sp. XMNu-256]|uniref:hypothetical protein n=1 Tax=Niallia sp. XMNu-256 TaxID=3082444 RepID=UPI0030CB2899